MKAVSGGEQSSQIRVFISSTYLDNVTRRKRVEEAVLQAGMSPIGMERFAASEHLAVEVCLKHARECEIFVLILARRYGWIPDEHDHSITELEYEAAKGANRSRLVFLLSEDAAVNLNADFDETERWKKQELLEAFKARCRADQTPASFEDDSLQAKVLQALHQWRVEADRRDRQPVPSRPTSQLLASDLDLDRYLRARE